MIQEEIYTKDLPTEKTGEPIINITGLHKSFGEHNQVLKGVDIKVSKGENLVILGKSGSGKSVTIKCLVGLVLPDEGKIKVFGTDITTLNENEFHNLYHARNRRNCCCFSSRC